MQALQVGNGPHPETGQGVGGHGALVFAACAGSRGFPGGDARLPAAARRGVAHVGQQLQPVALAGHALGEGGSLFLLTGLAGHPDRLDQKFLAEGLRILRVPLRFGQRCPDGGSDVAGHDTGIKQDARRPNTRAPPAPVLGARGRRQTHGPADVEEGLPGSPDRVAVQEAPCKFGLYVRIAGREAQRPFEHGLAFVVAARGDVAVGREAQDVGVGGGGRVSGGQSLLHDVGYVFGHPLRGVDHRPDDGQEKGVAFFPGLVGQ